MWKYVKDWKSFWSPPHPAILWLKPYRFSISLCYVYMFYLHWQISILIDHFFRLPFSLKHLLPPLPTKCQLCHGHLPKDVSHWETVTAPPTECASRGHLTPRKGHPEDSCSWGRVGTVLGVCPDGYGIPRGSHSLCHHPLLKKLTPRPHQMEEMVLFLPFPKGNERIRWDPTRRCRLESMQNPFK